MPRKVPNRFRRSGLPAPIPGEPFSLLGTLRRCTRGALTIEDCAELLTVSPKTIYKLVAAGKLPRVNAPVDGVRVDPKAWADILEHDNPHLKISARKQLRELRAA